MSEQELGAGDMGHIDASGYVDVPSRFSCHKLVTLNFSGNIEGIPPLVSSLDTTKKEELLNQFSAVPDDLILFAVGHHAEVNKTLDRLRVYVAHELGLIDNVSF